MLRGYPGETRHTPEERIDTDDKDSNAVVPLAIPVLAGPGAISTTIVYAHQARTGWDIAFLLFAALLVAGSVWRSWPWRNPSPTGSDTMASASRPESWG